MERFPCHRRRRTDAESVHIHQEFRVDVLVGPPRVGNDRHARGERLRGGVPPAVRDEAADRAVREHVRLPAPRDDLASVAQGGRRDAVQGALEEHRAVVVAHHPEERPAHAGQPRRYLGSLVVARLHEAPERNEHHRARRLRVEPRDAAVVTGGPVDFADFRLDERADWYNRQVLAKRRDGLVLQLVEGADEHPRYLLADDAEIREEHLSPHVLVGGVNQEGTEVVHGEVREPRDRQ
ncbi:hypothetical protein VPH35_045157 [Triticum aestivum]